MNEVVKIVCPLYGVTEIPPYSFTEIEGLIDYLKKNELPPGDLSFKRGTVTSDGRLDLCKQGIGIEGCRRIMNALEENTSIKSILLGTDGIGDAGANAVAGLVEKNSFLETVYLGCNIISADGTARLADALSNNTSVKGLWLKRNPIGPQGAKHIAELLKKNRTLRTLDLVNTNIGNLGLAVICYALLENTTLERIYIGGNDLDAGSAMLLREVLKKNRALKGLMMNVNKLGDEGASIIAEGLEGNATLEELGLASNGIGESGGVKLINAVLKSNIGFLDLGYSASTKVLGCNANHFTSPVAEAIVQLIVNNKTLSMLDLSRAGFNERDKKTIIAALKSNTSIIKLVLDGKRDEELNALLKRNNDLLKEKSSIPDVAAIRSVYRS